MNETLDEDFAFHLLKVVTKENLWYSIDEVMKWLYRTYPDSMRYNEQLAKAKRDANYDKFGRAKDDNGKTSNDMRDLGLIPPIFSDLITKFFGGALDDKGQKIKFYRTFFKKYPQFKTIDKI